MPENTSIKVYIEKRLRPIRLAFLVPISSSTALNTAIELASSLWGGRYCAMIPVFGRTPASWGDPPFKPPAAKVVLRGYIKAFEPDFVVNLTGKTYSEEDLGLDGEEMGLVPRIITADNFFGRTDSEIASYGVSLGAVIDDLYSKVFRFQLRHPPEVILPVAQDEKFAPFLGACFGSLLGGPEGKLTRLYLEALGGKQQEVEPQRLFEYFLKNFYYPLRAGGHDLDVSRLGFSLGPSVFFMDAHATQDIIDYWNLRAVGLRVLPLPKQWLEELRTPISEFIRQNDVPLPYNPQIEQTTTFIRSRSVSMQEMEDFAKSLGTSGKVSLQRWYPRIWDDWAREKDHVVRAEVTASRQREEVELNDGIVQFPGLSPAFADGMLGDGPQWINTLSFRRYLNDGKVAAVIPEGARGVGQLFRYVSSDPMWTTGEGLTVGCSLADREHHFRIPSPFEMTKAWAESHGFVMEQSSAGRITSSMLDSIKHVHGAWLFSNVELLQQLNKMAHGDVELLREGSDGNNKKNRARANVIHRAQLESLLTRISSGNKRRGAEQWLSALVEHRVIRVGLLLQCPTCSQRTWFGLGEITAKLTCQRCLNEFPFPSSSPPKDGWCYKVTGPFSTEDFAQGSYTVLLAARCLAQRSAHTEMTWLPGVLLKRGAQSLEADFAAFRQDTFRSKDAVTILGECKTFDTFKKKDVQRMEELGAQFPGSALAFCTLRGELNSQERKLISSLAMKGRKHLQSDRWQNPVLVLTGTELLDSSGIPHCWRSLPDHVKTVVAGYRGFKSGYEGIQELASCLQQLHLGMESYGAWAQKDRDKRLARRRKRAKPAATSPAG